jgi:multiple sugar transport system permease protein
MHTISRIQRAENRAAAMFLLPNAIGFFTFMLIPSIASVIISLFDWALIGAPTFRGLNNYRNLIVDRTFWITLGNTGVFVLWKVPLNIALSLLTAHLLNREIKAKNFFRLVMFLPMVCSSVAVAMIWLPLLESSDLGLVNHVLGWVGIDPIPWLASTRWAMPSVIFIAVWKETGYYMIIFLAGLQGISTTYYEAADIDGAGAVHKFVHITVPLITPTLFFVLITSIIGSFQVFDLANVLTAGGPANATNTLVMYIYQAGFRFMRMGYASALALVLFLVILIFTILQNSLAKRWVHTE